MVRSADRATQRRTSPRAGGLVMTRQLQAPISRKIGGSGLAMCLALTLGACGGSAPTEAARVKASAERYLAALSRGAGKEACAFLTPEAQRALVSVSRSEGNPASSCAEAAGADPFKGLPPMKVARVTMHDGRADVEIDDALYSDSGNDVIGWVKIKGRWLAADV